MLRSIDVWYKLTKLIGKGGFGEVFIAKNEYGENIAVKVKKIHSDPGIMEKSSELFRSELEALYNLDHPNILK